MTFLFIFVINICGFLTPYRKRNFHRLFTDVKICHLRSVTAQTKNLVFVWEAVVVLLCHQAPKNMPEQLFTI